jgi:hypothetical protein
MKSIQMNPMISIIRSLLYHVKFLKTRYSNISKFISILCYRGNVFSANKSHLLFFGIMTFMLLIPRAATSTTYKYQITDPLVGASLIDLNTEFWEPWNAPGGTEEGYFSISADGLVLGSFSVYLGLLEQPQLAKWAMAGDFRISFFFESSQSPGDYGNRIHVNIYEVAATSDELCGALVYQPAFDREGFGGLWTGYSPPQ